MDEDSLETSASDSSADRQGNVTIVPVNKFRLVRLWAPECGYTLAIVGGRAQSDMRGGFQTRMSKKLREIVFVFVFVFPPGAAVAPSRRGVVPGAAGGCLPPGRREGTYGCYLDSAPDRGDTSPYLIDNPTVVAAMERDGPPRNLGGHWERLSEDHERQSIRYHESS